MKSILSEEAESGRLPIIAFYNRCAVESILTPCITVQYGNCSAGNVKASVASCKMCTENPQQQPPSCSRHSHQHMGEKGFMCNIFSVSNALFSHVEYTQAQFLPLTLLNQHFSFSFGLTLLFTALFLRTVLCLIKCYCIFIRLYVIVACIHLLLIVLDLFTWINIFHFPFRKKGGKKLK